MWRLAYSLDQLEDEILSRWPGTTIWSIGDQSHQTRNSDHNPNEHGVVCAIDVLGRDKASQLWVELRRSKDERIKYMIFNGEIVNSTVSPWQVRNYTGSNQHKTHIHISVGRGPSGSSYRADLYDDRSPWLNQIVEDEMPDPRDVWDHRSKDGYSMEFYQRVGSDSARNAVAELTVMRRELEELAKSVNIDVVALAEKLAAELDITIAPGSTPQEIVDHLYERLGKDEEVG